MAGRYNQPVGNPNNRVPFDGIKLLMPAALIVLAVLTYVSVSWPLLGVGAVLVVVYALILSRIGVWRTMVGTSVVVSVLRSGPPSEILSEAAWYALQFVPILIAWVALLTKRPHDARRSDRNVVLFLAAFAVAALATNLTSLAPAATFPQTLMLAGMTGFLIFTYRRRWVTRDIAHGDVAMIFVLISVMQLVSVGSVVLGQGWAFDPDYGRFRGLFSNANYAGMMAAIGLAIGLYLLRVSRRRRLSVLTSMAVLLAALLMSGSRGALLAVGVGILVLVLSRAGRKVIIPLGALTGITVAFAALINPHVFDGLDKFFFRDSATADVTSGRLALYEGMLRLFAQSPFTGTGYRSIEALSPNASGLAGHNIYLTVLTETGLFGAAFFVGLAFSVIAASRSGRAGRPMLVVAVTIATVELTESSIYGWGGPTALTAWLMILVFAASGRFLPVEAAARDHAAVMVSVPPSATRIRQRVPSGDLIIRPLVSD